MSYNIRDELKLAFSDYLYLLQRGYSTSSLLKIVSDRYRLTRDERSILLRGVVERRVADQRKSKLVDSSKLINSIIAIDYYNVIVTIISYLSGKLVYLSLDGFLRDVSESHSSIKDIDSSLQENAILLLIDYLKTLSLAKAYFFLDSPVSNSAKLADKIRFLLIDYNIPAEVFLVKSADYKILNSKDSIAATSDSVIVDKSDRVFDLAYAVLKFKYNPEFLDLALFLI